MKGISADLVIVLQAELNYNYTTDRSFNNNRSWFGWDFECKISAFSSLLVPTMKEAKLIMLTEHKNI